MSSIRHWAYLFIERLEFALQWLKVRPSWQMYNLFANGEQPPSTPKITFKGLGLNNILQFMIEEGLPEDVANQLMNIVDEILEKLSDRGDRKPTTQILNEIENLKNKATKKFKEYNLIL